MKDITELRGDRQRRHLSQTDVARIMGTTQSALSRAERDGNPTQDFLQRYERALDELSGPFSGDTNAGAPATITPNLDQRLITRLIRHLEYASEDALEARSSTALRADRRRFNSVAMEIISACNCIRLISEQRQAALIAEPLWNDLQQLGNVLVHDYDEIDVESLYDTVTTDAPALAERLRPIVKAID